MQNEQHIVSGSGEQEIFFLDTLPLIRRFTISRLRGLYLDQAEDLVQRVALNLWRWRTRRAAESNNDPPAEGCRTSGANQSAVEEIDNRKMGEQNDLSSEQWLKLASAVTRNEISSFYRSKYRRETQLAETQSDRSMSDETDYNQSLTCPASARIEGNSRAEVASLLNQVWQILKEFPLHRRYAYLLGKEELIINMLTHGIATRRGLAESLNLTAIEFDIIVGNLPLADERIGNLIEMKTGAPASVKQIRTWRAKAKKRLAEKLKDKI